MSDTTTPVMGPSRVHLRSIPTGVEIDLAEYVEAALVHLVVERSEQLAELVEVAASAAHQTSYGNGDAAAVHERDALVQSLIEELPPLRVYGAQAARLAERIGESARAAMGGAA